MTYCAMCGRHHDPTMACFDGTDQVFGSMGKPKKASRKSASEMKKAVKQADRLAIKMVLFVVGLLAGAIILSAIFKR